MEMELKYDKNAPKFDDFLFIKKTVDVNSEPVLTSEVIETVKYPQKIKTTSLIKSNIAKSITSISKPLSTAAFWFIFMLNFIFMV